MRRGTAWPGGARAQAGARAFRVLEIIPNAEAPRRRYNPRDSRIRGGDPFAARAVTDVRLDTKLPRYPACPRRRSCKCRWPGLRWAKSCLHTCRQDACGEDKTVYDGLRSGDWGLGREGRGMGKAVSHLVTIFPRNRRAKKTSLGVLSSNGRFAAASCRTHGGEEGGLQ